MTQSPQRKAFTETKVGTCSKLLFERAAVVVVVVDGIGDTSSYWAVAVLKQRQTHVLHLGLVLFSRKTDLHSFWLPVQNELFLFLKKCHVYS